MSRLSNRLARIEATTAAPVDAPGSGILCFECPADMTDDGAKAIMAPEVADAPGLAVRIGDAPVLAYTIAPQPANARAMGRADGARRMKEEIFTAALIEALMRQEESLRSGEPTRARSQLLGIIERLKERQRVRGTPMPGEGGNGPN